MFPRVGTTHLGVMLRRIRTPLRRALSTSAPENYYKLLGVPETFHVDTSNLASRFKDLQRQWHPDKFANTPAQQKEQAANVSARLNEAYSVLRTPSKRAKHLLHIRSESDQAINLQPSFLAWVMEFRECIADANGNLTALNSLKEQVATSVSDCTSALSAAFEDDKLDVAAEETAKLQYLRRMELAIEDLSFKSLSSQE